MTRFFLSALAIFGLFLASCSKEDETSESCIESQISYPYVDVKGTVNAPGQISAGAIADSELFLTISPVACNSVKVNVGATLGGFDADCFNNVTANTISGTSDDGNSSYIYDKSAKSITVIYKTSTGFSYTVKALRP
jgi:hypothetical protein